MKKTILIIMTAAVLTGAKAFAEDGEVTGPGKVIEDGKSWLVMNFSPQVTAEECPLSVVSVVGDDMIDGFECKKMEIKNDDCSVRYSYAREEEGVVYAYLPSTENTSQYAFTPIMDFNQKMMDYLPDGRQVSYIDYIKDDDVSNIYRKRVYVGKSNPDYNVRPEYWVEGIGATSSSGWAMNTNHPSKNDMCIYIVAVYKDGNKIFERFDFKKEGHRTNGITNINADKADGVVRDLNGFEVAQPQPGNVYIKDGKKITVSE